MAALNDRIACGKAWMSTIRLARTTAQGEGEVEDEDEDEDPNDSAALDDDEGPASFIDLKTYPDLAIFNLGALDHAKFIARHEYDVFFKHAMSRVRVRLRYSLVLPTHFFVAGQPGIGNKSWVLIDIDDITEWSCPKVFDCDRCIIWTSSPQQRMNRFVDKFMADTWCMKTWPSKEIAAATQRFKMEPTVIRRRLDTEKPAARTLFTLKLGHVTTESIKSDAACPNNIFNFILGTEPAQSVIKVEPLVVLDMSGRAHLQRSDYSTDFLSARITQKIQEQLATLFYLSNMRTLAGKVVEALMHHALVGDMQLLEVFGPLRATTLALIGKADNFIYETAAPEVA
ncbi:hypothetical protein DXG03_001954 [Asterophora parasitica]|uniref:Uncharacterized protein n=1 Tax=Asterophora parasitica TaxID=117018 RepID=A0A9P7GDV0_9AGAR|nr:hypothetical protein DXG03_001954 [Asterophora parasitica]